jgi:hypothetical protein
LLHPTNPLFLTLQGKNAVTEELAENGQPQDDFYRFLVIQQIFFTSGSNC